MNTLLNDPLLKDFDSGHALFVRSAISLKELAAQHERFRIAAEADRDGEPTTPVLLGGEEYRMDTNVEAYLMTVGSVLGAIAVMTGTYPTAESEDYAWAAEQADAILFDENMGNPPGTSTT
jgi:hypothetical protein